MPILKQPYYELFPNINGFAIIYVDDVPVFSHLGKQTEDGIVDAQVPINHILLQSGKHTVTGKMLPRYGQKTLTENEGLSIDFNLSEFSNWKATRYSFFPSINSPDSYFDLNNKVSNIIKGLPVFEISTQIEVELPFILNGWQNSVDLKKIKSDDLRKEVLEFYKQIHSLLLQHNATKFLDLSKDKEALQTQAFYFDETKKIETKKSIIDLFAEGLEVLLLIETELKVEICAYGKLVYLAKLDGSPALQFKSPDKLQSNVELEIKLHKKNAATTLSII